MLLRSTLLVSTLAAAACSGGSGGKPVTTLPTDPVVESPPAPVSPRIRTLTADEPITTGSGATFTASKGWKVEEWPDRVVLTSPEGDLTMIHVEVAAASRDAAIAAAWGKVDPAFDLPIGQAQELPARGGWDAAAQVLYVTPAAEQRLVAAVARRKADTWYVALIDGKLAAYDRRGAQLGTAFESLKVAGLDEESFAGKAAHPLDAARLAELDAFVTEAHAATGVPGAAIAIVQGGKIVYERGLGVRQAGKKGAVTPKTLFMIGSIGKSLTTLMMARLVEAGTFGWDTPVVDVLPSFALGDEGTTRAATMRHTACACTGMPRQDFEFIFEGAVTPEQRLATMATMKPSTGFGETFQYSNLMVAAGGYAAAHARAPKQKLGAAYDAAMTELVFKPLGMKTTTFDFKKVAKAEHAAPHPTDVRGKPVARPIQDELWVVPIRPAGGAWSSVRDMARFLLLELGNGELDGKRVVDEAQLLARRAPQIKITDDQSYGLGLMVATYRGIPMVSHSGGTGGFTTAMTLLPEHGVGMIILTNQGGSGLFGGVVARRVFELLFDGQPEAAADLADAIARRDQRLADELTRIELEPDAAWFGALAGTWAAPGLGTIELRTDKKQAVLDAGEWKVPVGRKTDLDGTVKLITTGGIASGLELVPREQDGATVLVLEAGQHEYVFERVTKPAGKAKKKAR
jgi:CubicO group peptidase (beta-lactamase class C family)